MTTKASAQRTSARAVMVWDHREQSVRLMETESARVVMPGSSLLPIASHAQGIMCRLSTVALHDYCVLHESH